MNVLIAKALKSCYYFLLYQFLLILSTIKASIEILILHKHLVEMSF